jgi:hypothetical protein
LAGRPFDLDQKQCKNMINIKLFKLDGNNAVMLIGGQNSLPTLLDYIENKDIR